MEASSRAHALLDAAWDLVGVALREPALLVSVRMHAAIRGTVRQDAVDVALGLLGVPPETAEQATPLTRGEALAWLLATGSVPLQAVRRTSSDWSGRLIHRQRSRLWLSLLE